MRNNKKNEKPEILGARDLAHLNKGQRISMIGMDKWQSRKDFLKKLLGLSAVITLPGILSLSCGGDGSSSGSGCTSDSGCSSDGSSGCACQTNIVVSAPTVISTYPFDGAEEIHISFISITFSKAMDQTSVEEAMSVDPEITGLDFTAPGNWWSADSKTVEYQVGTNIKEGSSYTFSIDGSAKSQDGFYLNQTEAGGGGTSYFFNIYNKSGSCGSDCGCESYEACSCQFDGGVGCPYYGGICWCEVQCGCQLYRI